MKKRKDYKGIPYKGFFETIYKIALSSGEKIRFQSGV